MFDFYLSQDIQIADVDLKAQYYRAFLAGNITQAQSILDKNPQLKSKVLNAEMLNMLLNSMMYLEIGVSNSLHIFLSTELAKLQININSLIALGEYNLTTTYKVNNSTIYNDKLYYCKKTPPKNTLPTNSGYWVELDLEGKQGSHSLGVSYVGSWNSSIRYNRLDMVVYENELYVAKQGNNDVPPSTSEEDWLKATALVLKVISVSKIEPTYLEVGDIWMRVVEE